MKKKFMALLMAVLMCVINVPAAEIILNDNSLNSAKASFETTTDVISEGSAETAAENATITNAGLYQFENDLSSEIKQLAIHAGSFSYNTGTEINIEDPDTTSYDSVFLSFDVVCKNGKRSKASSYLNITLPEGLSFSSEQAVETKCISIQYDANGSATVWEQVYLLYSDKYNRSQELEIQYPSGSIKICDLNVITKTTSIPLAHEDLNVNNYNINFDPSIFENSPDSYNQQIALISAYLSDMMECTDKPLLRERIKTDLVNLGFSHIKYSGSTKNTINFGIEEESVCAIKKYISSSGKVKTIMICAIQGSDNLDFSASGSHALADWIGNLMLGIQSDSVNKRHENLWMCIYNNYKTMEDYCLQMEAATSSIPTSLLITGHSRGGGIANGVSAKATDHNLFSNIYSYTFAGENMISAKESEKSYSNIYNIVNKSDLVPYLPTNYYKYGTYMQICEGSDNLLDSGNHSMYNYINGINNNLFDSDYMSEVEKIKKRSFHWDKSPLNSIEDFLYRQLVFVLELRYPEMWKCLTQIAKVLRSF